MGTAVGFSPFRILEISRWYQNHWSNQQNYSVFIRPYVWWQLHCWKHYCRNFTNIPISNVLIWEKRYSYDACYTLDENWKLIRFGVDKISNLRPDSISILATFKFSWLIKSLEQKRTGISGKNLSYDRQVSITELMSSKNIPSMSQ